MLSFFCISGSNGKADSWCQLPLTRDITTTCYNRYKNSLTISNIQIQDCFFSGIEVITLDEYPAARIAVRGLDMSVFVVDATESTLVHPVLGGLHDGALAVCGVAVL
jgi:hypothetical protein